MWNTTRYQGEAPKQGPPKARVTECLNELFSLVQGLGGTAVVRTYIDQLAQVLSALVGWSKIDKCNGGGDGRNGCKGTDECTGNDGGGGKCKYLEDVKRADRSCDTCGCIKVEKDKYHLGRGCTKCSGSRDGCNCGTGGCTPGKECQCALAGKCCKCCCKGGCGKCKEEKDRLCSCDKEKKDTSFGDEYRIHSYTSAYPYKSILLSNSFLESTRLDVKPYWKDLTDLPVYFPGSASQRRHQCAQTLLGSVCLIWSGLTYMYWTGKYPHAKNSPYWNNHILDGSGLDDGTLSQWLQALGFPSEMLNNHGPGNRWDAIINGEFSDKLLLGFKVPSGSGAKDEWDNTARNPTGMNFAGFIHTIHRDSFNNEATVFRNGTTSGNTDTNIHKYGPLFKLYILSCAYFTGLQKKNATQSTTQSTTSNTPRTIRDILYWLSALPYSQAYKEMLKYSKGRLEEVLKKPGETDSTTSETQLKFTQQGRSAPITVHEFNLFAHFQAVTQYCPLVLIGIQGGLYSTNSTTPAIHALYANTECSFTYPTVSIQAYNQVVHYIRALFYQLYFLRKQCAVKVALGGKWRECRYGNGVLGKDVVSWMCLGCDPMEHDRKSRVTEMGDKLKKLPLGSENSDSYKLRELVLAIGEVVVQLGNAQEALERRKGEEITKVKEKLTEARTGLDKAKEELEKKDGLNGQAELTKAKTALDELTNGSSSGILKDVETKLETAQSDVTNVDPGKNKISAAIHKVHEVLTVLEKAFNDQSQLKGRLSDWVVTEFTNIKQEIISICSSPKCPGCTKHSDKCGQKPTPTTCPTCLQPTTTGVPSPLQAFLEDRLPGFSCQEVPETENPDYPLAASHLGHCNGSGQCCPLPMGFRGQFHGGSTSDMTGQRLYGILYFFSNENMMQSCVYTLVRVTAALSATTPQVLGDVFGFFRGGVGNPVNGEGQQTGQTCNHNEDPKTSTDNSKYFCGWCASGLRDVVKEIEWIPKTEKEPYREKIGKALIEIKGDKDSVKASTNLSTLTDSNHFLSPLTGELYTAVSATFGNTYLSWVLYLSDALHSGLESLASAFQEIECRGCRGCDPNKCKKGAHGATGNSQCNCSSIVSCTGVLPVLYRHGFSYGNPFNLEGYHQKDKEQGDYSIEKKDKTVKHCHEFLESLKKVIDDKKEASKKDQETTHPLTKLLSEVGQLQYDIRLPWIFVLTLAWLVAVLYLAFGAIWPLDWTHMRSHWLPGGEHQWQCMWYKVMTGRKGVELIEYFGRR